MAGPNTQAPTYRSNTARIAAINSPPTSPKPKLLDQVRQAIRARHYSPRTEETYVHWIKRFIFFHNKRHPAEMGVHSPADQLGIDSGRCSRQRLPYMQCLSEKIFCC